VGQYRLRPYFGELGVTALLLDITLHTVRALPRDLFNDFIDKINYG
jgi:hypothetical protein